MKRHKRTKAITPETVGQHIEEEFRKDPEFRSAYNEEIAKLALARKIRMLRTRMHLTQTDLAKRMRTVQQTISRLEDPENSEITVATLAKVAMATGTRLSIDFASKRHQKRKA